MLSKNEKLAVHQAIIDIRAIRDSLTIVLKAHRLTEDSSMALQMLGHASQYLSFYEAEQSGAKK